ncbi:Sporulation domain protein [Chloroherpeton thalassium ATCC 35110]|uniref:Sporulation domain protein n=1 Tax=Chloroherpeton thalassium (strain ATCC 35110 / GB-78) TaxID=517418 RepID=B3QT27_CHLT3|nr:SPOR domain-containing protein [Chloroherpeton thalassium]ACF12670.1 Sporulation domain protein [Chloroherpeton thalassium ATCC 35110]
MSWLYEEGSSSSKNLYIIIGAVAVVLLLAIGGFFIFSGGGESEEKMPDVSAAHTVEAPVEEKASEAAQAVEESQEKEMIPEQSAAETPQPERRYAQPNREIESSPAPSKASSAISSRAAASRETPWFVPPQLTKKMNLSDGGYAISVGSFPDKSKADALVETYAKKGIAAAVWETEVRGKTFNRVLVGSFSSRAEALRTKEEAASVLPGDAFIVKVK